MSNKEGKPQYDGASTSSNAVKLLEYIGFPEEIIEEAMDFLS